MLFFKLHARLQDKARLFQPIFSSRVLKVPQLDSILPHHKRPRKFAPFRGHVGLSFIQTCQENPESNVKKGGNTWRWVGWSSKCKNWRNSRERELPGPCVVFCCLCGSLKCIIPACLLSLLSTFWPGWFFEISGCKWTACRIWVLRSSLTRTCLTAVCWVTYRSPHTNFSTFCQKEPTADIRDTQTSQTQEWRTDSFSWTPEKQHSLNHFSQICLLDFPQMMTLHGAHLCLDLRFSEIWARISAFQTDTEITSRWSRRVKGKSPGEGFSHLKRVRRFATFWDWFSAEDVVDSSYWFKKIPATRSLSLLIAGPESRWTWWEAEASYVSIYICRIQLVRLEVLCLLLIRKGKTLPREKSWVFGALFIGFMSAAEVKKKTNIRAQELPLCCLWHQLLYSLFLSPRCFAVTSVTSKVTVFASVMSSISNIAFVCGGWFPTQDFRWI